VSWKDYVWKIIVNDIPFHKFCVILWAYELSTWFKGIHHCFSGKYDLDVATIVFSTKVWSYTWGMSWYFLDVLHYQQFYASKGCVNFNFVLKYSLFFNITSHWRVQYWCWVQPCYFDLDKLFCFLNFSVILA
jgi:hypothetical protein